MDQAYRMLYHWMVTPYYVERHDIKLLKWNWEIMKLDETHIFLKHVDVSIIARPIILILSSLSL